MRITIDRYLKSGKVLVGFLFLNLILSVLFQNCSKVSFESKTPQNETLSSSSSLAPSYPTPTPTPGSSPIPSPSPVPSPAPPPPLSILNLTNGWNELAANGGTKLINKCPVNFLNYSSQLFGSNGCSAVVDAWGGAVADTYRNKLVLWGGGHFNYFGNEIYALDIGSLSLQRLNDPSVVPSCFQSASCSTTELSNTTYSDGKPLSRHTTSSLTYISSTDQMYGGLGATSPVGNVNTLTWLLNFSNFSWTNALPGGDAFVPHLGNGAGQYGVAEYDKTSNKVFVYDSYTFSSYDVSTNKYTRLIDYWSMGYYVSSAIDSSRKKMLIVGGGEFISINIDQNSPTKYSYENWNTLPSMSACSPVFSASAPGIAYDSKHDRIVGWPGGGNTIYVINPDTKTCTSITSYSNGPSDIHTKIEGGVFGRFRYFPDYDVFALVLSSDLNAYLLKLP